MHLREIFTLDGACCEEYGIRLQKPLFFSSAEARVETISIPGRNGNLHITDGSYENVSATAECFALSENVSQTVERAIGWLMSDNGYRRLEVSDDPGCFRLARIAASPERDFRMRKLAPFSIEFDCDPRRFLTDGEYPVYITNFPSGIANPTAQIATPMITVYGTEPGEIHINGVTVQINELTSSITLDCEKQTAYFQREDGVIENKNSAIYAPVFPTLSPGNNGVACSSGITRIEIIPRWWTL